VLQLIMLRMLTAMPPGKVRFTILDPVGLGENFASFMHLADFDEQLIASRIWTDARQIDEQLTRLTAHMETVLQKYLRNEFATIHEYNAQAGEVAEPFQVLVVANFPTSFSEAAARKLVSIATSGPRCGVYTLIMVDRKLKMPANFDLNDLKAGAVHLDWVSGNSAAAGSERFQSFHDVEPPPVGAQQPEPRETGASGFRWRYPAFEQLPLSLDRPPSAERFNDVLRAAGRAAKDSMRVEVPFEQVAPPEAEYWTGDSGKELVVPIGRAGARRLQPVRLGKGTSQHLLVCGKTGSGKSTFLHGLITNTALYYSPDEVEFYLIDFKKGVEFKTYATHRLPHARVIAIESEREFGLSVLERLDAELRRRGDLLRSAGVQDLPDYRKARPGEAMPRILLVIDEFQELFVEDDKLAQDANLLLDRLVRQGRAFGIHVLLGSQTLSGAYSLARSTMGQMAVRVALQCSEADANLILSDERNMAARFLNRPGEAIYNDQNGLLAGNHPFQVVWLPESKRVEYLKKVEAKERNGNGQNRTGHARPLIVFEGDQPADPADNVDLREILRNGPTGPVSAPQKAWLGAAVAIKEPTAATFARHAGSNMLVVGSWEESALGVLTNAVVALAAQNAPRSEERGARIEAVDESLAPRSSVLATFYILDGTRPESPEAGTWQRIADALPHNIEVATPRDTARIINQLAGELARRESTHDEDAPPIYLVIFNGGRFRDLRRNEDDFSFSSSSKPPSADRQWAEILRNGPAWGIHTLLWCDSYNNVTRMLDRMTLREFEMRIAFQMSAADSSSFLDNPAATRLRQHRGLFASEDLGTLEKFRPYGVPTDAWLREVRQACSKSE
jgi:DNA segregation ATPase FtsK/SpoIIIE, S-DNA-T family